ncbi:hypothetical protein NDU88_004573 [Pleurodeles waltl]|uniref:Uncharacterized protein n=1 Tax=Pleurodeles waltl TaxID=8319 RepID=A0AAV7UFK2_PLEWA|nr:hypothetical protein NDU88_004573 [Pleurodeles waltl]
MSSLPIEGAIDRVNRGADDIALIGNFVDVVALDAAPGVGVVDNGIIIVEEGVDNADDDVVVTDFIDEATTLVVLIIDVVEVDSAAGGSMESVDGMGALQPSEHIDCTRAKPEKAHFLVCYMCLHRFILTPP